MNKNKESVLIFLSIFLVVLAVILSLYSRLFPNNNTNNQTPVPTSQTDLKLIDQLPSTGPYSIYEGTLVSVDSGQKTLILQMFNPATTSLINKTFKITAQTEAYPKNAFAPYSSPDHSYISQLHVGSDITIYCRRDPQNTIQPEISIIDESVPPTPILQQSIVKQESK